MEMNQAKIVDLSYAISSDMLVFPGMERPVFQWVYRVNSEGANLTKMTIMAHTGTHVDAPKHFLDDVPCIDEVPVQRLFGRTRMFRRAQEPAGQEIALEEVLSTGFDLEEGSIFVLSTGIERYAETPKYNRSFPLPAPDLFQWLVEKKIKAYMTDAPAIDPVGSPDSPNHHLILGAGIPIVENLCNLARVPEDRYFLVFALPVKLGGREAAPCRAVAFPEVESL
jgi:arylformamidase